MRKTHYAQEEKSTTYFNWHRLLLFFFFSIIAKSRLPTANWNLQDVKREQYSLEGIRIISRTLSR